MLQANIEIEKERDRCLGLWSMLELRDDITIVFSKRLRVSLGLTYPERGEIRLNQLTAIYISWQLQAL